MPSDDSSARDALNHQSLKVSRDDPGPRPMIAVLDPAARRSLRRCGGACGQRLFDALRGAEVK
jgi:hypothetical protein